MNRYSSLWDFALAIYAKPGVSDACLQLQDQHKVDIPLLFFCCWAGFKYGAFSADQQQRALYFANTWSDASVRQLRHLRRQMKSSYDNHWPVPEASWQALREQVKTLELAAEKSLLEGLEDMARQWSIDFAGLEAAKLNCVTCFGIEPELPAFCQVLTVIEADA